MNHIITPLELLSEHHRRQADDVDAIARDLKEYEVNAESYIELAETVYAEEFKQEGSTFGHDLRIARLSI